MKPMPLIASRQMFPLVAAIAAMLNFGAPSASAVNYYWDSNGTTAGLGDVAGTWGTSSFRGTVGNIIIDGTDAVAASTTGTGDSIQFGTNNLALGSIGSTIGIVGTNVTINTIIFGSGQGSQGVTLSGGGGTITLGGTAPSSTPTITANNTGANTIGAVIAGTAGMVKGGAGTLTLTGANTYTGATTISGGGTLQVGNGSSGNLYNTTPSALTFNNGGGVFNVQSISTGSTQAMGALTFSTTGAGEGTVQSTYGTSGNAAITFASLAARGAGATGNFVISGGSGGTNKITISGATTGTLLDKGLFFGGGSYAAYDTGGYVRAYGSGDADYLAAPTDITMGATTSSSNVDLTTGNITAQITASTNTINLRGNSIAMDEFETDQELLTNGILSSGSPSATIGGGTTPRLLTTALNGELIIRVAGGSDSLNISSIIENNGNSSLTKSGAGTLTLSGANTYTGTTTISSGTLALSGGSAIADTGAVALANGPGATLLLNSSETIGNLSGGGFSGGNVNVQGNTLTLADNSSTTFGGQFIGSGGVIKTGTGTLTLSNKNTFSGAINVNAGTLAFAYGYDNTANPSPMSSGGTITLANNTNLLMAAATNVAGGITGGNQNKSGQVVSNAINISSGTANIRTLGNGGNDSRYVLSGNVTGGASGSQTLSILQGSASTNGGGDRQSILVSGPIANGGSGTLGLNVDFQGASGAAQQVYVALSGQNTFTGNIAVSNTRGLTASYGSQGGYLALGGEVIQIAFGSRTVYVGSGGLGYVSGSGSGSVYSYNGTISLATGTFLDYVSNASQTLGGVISGGGGLGMEGTGVGTLTLNAANTFSGSTTIKSGILVLGNSLALQNSTLDTGNSVANTLKTDGALTSLTFSGFSGSKNLDVASGAMFATSGSGYGNITALTLNSTAGQSSTYSGNIVNGAAGMTLTKSGAGTQILSGANSYTGGTNITAGTLQFGKPVSQPASGTVAVGTGSTLAINLGGTGEWTTGTSGNGTIGGLLAGVGGQSGGTVTYTGNVALGLDTTNAISTPNYTGAIADVGTSLGITKLGVNTLVLSGTNTYTGGTTITSGTLQFGKLVSQPASGAVAVGTGSTLAVNLGGTGEWTTGTSGNGTIGGLLAGLGGQSGGTVTYSGNVALGFDTTNGGSTQTYSANIVNVATTLGITKIGANTLVLSGANAYTGTTTVNGGTLLLDMTGSGVLAATSALTLGGGNFQVTGKTSGTTTQTLGALTLTGKTNNVITLDPNGGTSTTLTLGNAWTRNVGSSLLIDYSSAKGGTRQVATAGATTGYALSNGIYGGILVKDTAGAIGFAARPLTNISRFDDTTGATLADNSNAAANNFTTLNTVYTSGTLAWSNGITTRSVNSLTIDTTNNGGTINMGAAANVLTLTSGGILFKGAADATLTGGRVGADNSEVIVHQTGAGTFTLGSLVSSGTGSLTKDGTGTLAVTNASNAYSGSTTLNAGTLQYASKTAFGTSTLYLTGGTKMQKITEEGINSGFAMANNITLSGGTVEMNVAFTGLKDQWFSGKISGSGGLRVTGDTRAVTLTGNNDFTGGVTLNSTSNPWIRLGNANGLGAGTLTINTTAGAQTMGLGATTTMTVANNVVINSGATFNLGGDLGNMTLTGIVSGAGNLNKSDTAATTFTLSGANTYTGTTRVTTGTLALGASNVLPDSTNVTLGSATLNASTFTDTAGTLAVTGSAVINLGSGGALAFANSSGVPWSGTLNITGTFVAGSSIRFGTGTGGLTSGQLANISVNGSGAGTYTLNAGGYLVAASASPYNSWAALKGLDDSDAAHASAKSADPDGDGHNNFYEFAFDGNPRSGANDGKIVCKIATISSTQVLTLTVPVRNGAVFTASGGDQLSGLIDGVYYRIEGSPDLTTFAESISEVTGTDATAIQTGLPVLSSDWSYRTFRVPGTVSSASKDFMRAKVSETP